MSADPRVVTRADDAGSFEAANLAIQAACNHGTVRNVSVMANTPAIEHAFAVLGDRDDVDFGLHVTLTCEWEQPRWGSILPATEVATTVHADGTQPRTTNWLHDKEASLAEMVAETRAQLRRLREIGFNITYLDEHMGVGWIPGLGAAFAALAQEEGLFDLTRHDGLVKIPAPPEDIPANDYLARDLASYAMLESGRDYLHVAHPCLPQGDVEAAYGAGFAVGEIGIDREAQGLGFTSPQILALVQERQIQPIRCSEL